MGRIKLFEQFISEAEITDSEIISKLERVKFLRDKLKDLKTEMQDIETELKDFDVQVKPMFEMMKSLDDKLATAQGFALKITKYDHTRTDVGWKNVVDQSLEKVDEAAREIIKAMMESNKKIVDVKFSFEIEQLNESKIISKLKDILSKAYDKLVGVFNKNIEKVDSANKKLELLTSS
jgi:hypothetical protein